LAYGRFVQEYQKNAVNGASPLQLVIMLYDGSLRFMEAGKHAIAERDLEKQNSSLQRAQKIVMELMSCLDMDKGGEVATNLFALYSYVLNELVTANVEDSAEPIDRSIRVMSQLRESWSELDKMSRVSMEPIGVAA
jgi:flagellar secretion chaperone FliS